MGKAQDQQAKLPSPHNWQTTDEDEIARRRYRAQTESLLVRNLDPRFPIFSNFAVKSKSGRHPSRTVDFYCAKNSSKWSVHQC